VNVGGDAEQTKYCTWKVEPQGKKMNGARECDIRGIELRMEIRIARFSAEGLFHANVSENIA
jgi:hypothetical protein